jgi:hypothetical protein
LVYRVVVGTASALALALFVLVASSGRGRKYIARIRNRQADRGDADRDAPATPD